MDCVGFVLGAIVEHLNVERIVGVYDSDLTEFVVFRQDLFVSFLGFELNVTVT